MIKSYRLLIAALFLIPASAGATIQVSTIPAAQWGAPDETIGLGGSIVEDFEDVLLMPGLRFLLADAAGNFTGTPTGTLPAIFDPVAGDPWGDSFETGVWDGRHVLVNTPTNQSQYYGSSDWRPVMFVVPAGTPWLAMGLQQVTNNHELMVNGASLGRLTALGFPLTPQRNGVLLVTSDDPSEPIVSVSFGGRGDAFVVDHVVFADNGPVPLAPTSFGSVKALFHR